MNFKEASALLHTMEQNLAKVMRGQNGVIRQVLACMASGGHLLLEDFPGTGKTTLAKAMAKCIARSEFRRLQFTPDLLPSDILGVSILDPAKATFKFQPGPIFANILLADEINRSSPRTQSALLEAMAEGQATIEGTYHALPSVFFVIATQNPVEFRGTYPLPEAQMDRFAMQCSLGYVSIEDEMLILQEQREAHPLDRLESVCDLTQLAALRECVKQVTLHPRLQRYIVELVAATRHHESIQLAASPRASLALARASQAMALLCGQEQVTPNLIQDLAINVLAHRLVIEPEARFAGNDSRRIVQEILQKIPVPV